jgi:uncharacterized protein (TIGR00369 family)
MGMDEQQDFHDHLGMQRTEWREGYVEIVLDVKPRHLNRGGIVHGGVLLSLLDEAGGAAGNWCSVKGNRRWAVTVDLNCHFVGRSSEGRVTVIGEVVSAGRTLYFAKSEARDSSGRLLAFGSSTHRWRRGSEKVEGLPL